MATWFLGKIRFTKEIDAGKFQTVTEVYLIDAVSYTEAESRLYEELGDNAPDFRVSSITPLKVQEVFQFDGHQGSAPEKTWWKVKVAFSRFDEKAKKEKKDVSTFLVNADTVVQAYLRIQERFGRMEDAEIIEVIQTPILEVMPYHGERTNPVEEIAKDFHESMQQLADEADVILSVSGPGIEEKVFASPGKKKPLKTGKDYSPKSKNQHFPKKDTINYD